MCRLTEINQGGLKISKLALPRPPEINKREKSVPHYCVWFMWHGLDHPTKCTPSFWKTWMWTRTLMRCSKCSQRWELWASSSRCIVLVQEDPSCRSKFFRNSDKSEESEKLSGLVTLLKMPTLWSLGSQLPNSLPMWKVRGSTNLRWLKHMTKKKLLCISCGSGGNPVFYIVYSAYLRGDEHYPQNNTNHVWKHVQNTNLENIYTKSISAARMDGPLGSRLQIIAINVNFLKGNSLALFWF